jgi:general secretion pathway protein D
MRGSRARQLALVVLAAAVSAGCGAKWAYRHGNQESRKGNWDMAVAHYSKALQKDPDSVQYRLALERARSEASRAHYEAARKHLEADELDAAVDELEIATKYDSGNDRAAEALRVTQAKIRKRDDAKKKAAEVEKVKSRAKERVVVPVLSPRSQVPLTLNFPDASLEKIFETLRKLSGVNILFDESFKDKKVNISLADVTFEEALDQLTFTNRLFYKVLDQKTLLIIPDTAQKRRQYDDVLVRTFYLANADPAETLTLVKNLTGVTKAAVNPSLAAVTVLGTFDELAFAERVIEANDKPKGEVLVEVKILEVNRDLMKQYGLELSQYQSSVQFNPTSGNLNDGGFATVRAHLLSSLNLSDFVVSIPSTIIAHFLESDSNTRLLAAPKLRAAEGKKTSLVIGSQVPVPTTTFQQTTVGGGTFSPTTSFQYRDVGVKLDLTPKITATGEITLEMAVEFSDLGPTVEFAAGQRQPTFLTRSVTGILRLEDGESTLLGGLINRRETRSTKGVVGISNIPLLGDLLSSKNNGTQESEILISITPHLVRGPELSEDDFTALYVGSKENIRVPSARPPLFGPEEPEEEAPPAAAEAGAAPAPQASPTPAPAKAEPAGVAPTEAAPQEPPAAPGQATLTPPRSRLAVGETVSLDVVLTTPASAQAVEVVLVYDAKVLEATGVVAGSLLTLDGAQVDAQQSLEPGRVRATFRRPTPAKGAGVVASVAFRALQPGSTPVGLESVTLTSEAGPESLRPAAAARVVVGPAEARQEEKK